jgi:spore cortex biosynthesis protein YabQ
MSLHDQIKLLFAMLVMGMALGVMYDGYREWLARGKKNKIIHAIVDLFSWLSGAIFVFAVLQWQSEGVLRIYVLLALSLGLVIYLKTVSGLFRWLWKHLLRIVSALVGFFVLKWWRILTRLWKR